MEDLNVANRLKGFIDSQSLTNSQFADNCGIPRPSLSQILSGRNKKISDVIVGQIHRAYPDLSILWLLFGEGDMLMSDKSSVGNDVSNGNLFDENLDFTGKWSEIDNRENLSALNNPINKRNSIDNQSSELELKVLQLQSQIDKMTKNPRKVTQITVYYDDSTFETFYPKQ